MEKYIIIIIVFIIILLAILKSTKKDARLEINKLIEYLGGKDNIVSSDYNLSRFVVTLRDITKVNKEAIQKLGAKGIVEIDNQLKIVFDKDAVKLKKCIEDLLKQNVTKR
mgnify:CR=1 FL=1